MARTMGTPVRVPALEVRQRHLKTTQAGDGPVVYDGTTLTFSAIGLTSTTSAIANGTFDPTFARCSRSVKICFRGAWPSRSTQGTGKGSAQAKGSRNL